MACCCTPSNHGSHVFVPKEERRCTDCLILIPYILTVLGAVAVAVAATVGGNPDHIIYPTDYLGQSCGKPGTDLEALPRAFYPRLDEDIQAQLSTLVSGNWWDFVPYTLCVAECPPAFGLENTQGYGGLSYPGAANATAHEVFYSAFKTVQIASRCFPTFESATGHERLLCGLPNCTDPTLNSTLNGTLSCTSVETLPHVHTAWEICPSGDTASAECAAREAACVLPVKEVNSQTFVPVGADDDSTTYTYKLAEFVQYSSAVMASVYDARVHVAVLGVVGPVCLGFAWMALLWLFAGVVVYLALFALLLLLVLACCWLYVKAGLAADLGIDLSSLRNSTLLEESSTSTTVYAVFAVICTILTLLVITLVLLWQKMIARAIAIIRESTTVFRELPTLMVWPLLTTAKLVIACAYGVVIAFFIATLDDTSYSDVASALSDAGTGDLDSYLPDHQWQLILSWVVHIFAVVWTVNVILAAAWTTQAGAVSQWFFAHEPGEAKPWFGLGCSTLWCSFYRVLRFHLGSMAFGGLITAICSLLRWLLATLDYYTHELQKKNMLLRLVLKCVQCYMYCLEKTIQFITYYGYIFVALDGSSFCKGCIGTFGLIAKYPAQVTVNRAVGALISLIISFSVPAACGLATFVSLDRGGKQWPIYPSLLVCLSSFVIASAICSTLKCVIDSIFLCAFKDMTPGPARFMSANLRSAFGIDTAEEELRAAGRKPLRTVDTSEVGLLEMQTGAG